MAIPDGASSQEFTCGVIQERTEALYNIALSIRNRLRTILERLLAAVPEDKNVGHIGEKDLGPTPKLPALDGLSKRLLESAAVLGEAVKLLARLENQGVTVNGRRPGLQRRPPASQPVDRRLRAARARRGLRVTRFRSLTTSRGQAFSIMLSSFDNMLSRPAPGSPRPPSTTRS